MESDKIIDEKKKKKYSLNKYINIIFIIQVSVS